MLRFKGAQLSAFFMSETLSVNFYQSRYLFADRRYMPLFVYCAYFAFFWCNSTEQNAMNYLTFQFNNLIE